MNEETHSFLNEAAANIVENIAYHVAQEHDGIITVNQLISYLPMSLNLIRLCLDNMVDGHTVIKGEQDGFPVYEFAHSRDTYKPDTHNCLSCMMNPRSGNEALCKDCMDILKRELNRLAESTGWPAKAVYEHEILYLAAQGRGPYNAADLAGNSRYTLKRMQKKLKTMNLEQYLILDLDKTAATIFYQFPKISYPKEVYQRNMAFIRSYPMSVTEDMELKIIRITLCLAGMLLAIFILALLRIPLPLLIICFIILAPIISICIWRHRDKPPED